MATVAEGQRPQTPAQDPWRLGWRYVERQDADGAVRVEQVPLTERDLLFPQLGDFIVNRTPHHQDLGYLYGVFKNRLKDKPDAVVLGDCRVDFNLPGVEPLGPDVIVLREARRKEHDWGTFDIQAEGARPVLVIEITSPDTRKNDFGVKRNYYEQAGVANYVIVDVRENKAGERELRLLGWRHAPSGWEELPLNERGWLWLEPVQLWLGTGPADEQRPYVHVACYEGDHRRINTWAEEVHARAAAEARADAEAKTRADAETIAALERQRADAERSRADEMLERMRAMEAELRRLRGEN